MSDNNVANEENSQSNTPLVRRAYLRTVGAVGGGTILLSAPQVTAANTENENNDDKIEIKDWHEFNAIRDNLEGEYVLIDDLDEETEGYNEHVGENESGFEPIGDNFNQFAGVIDGDGYEISDVVIDKDTSTRVGLFGETSEEADIKNLDLINVKIIGSEIVGSLVGENSGQITHCSVSGEISSTSGRTGALVGINDGGEIADVTASGSLSTQNIGAGGLVGENNDGKIVNSEATNKVVGESSVGGLVGNNSGKISQSLSDGEVTGDTSVGGLVGGNSGEIINSSASSSVTGEEGIGDALDTSVGGIAGNNGGTIEDCKVDSDIIITGDSAIGGLIGENTGEVFTSSVENPVLVDGRSIVGGLVGMNFGQITDSNASAEVEGESDIGGLVGVNRDSISGSDASGDVSGEDSSIGGFVGRNASVITNSEATGSVTGNDDSTEVGGFVGDDTFGDEINNVSSHGNVIGGERVGGLVGDAGGDITESLADGDVIGDSDVGGLVGSTGGDTEVIDSVALGDVTGQADSFTATGGLVGRNRGDIIGSEAGGNPNGDENVGGLVGRNSGKIIASNSTGDVNGDEEIGGLAGYNSGTIEESIASGEITANSKVGGLVGQNGRVVTGEPEGEIFSSYAIGDVFGNSVTGGLVGENTAEIQRAYAVGFVEEVDDSGGLVGENKDEGTVNNSYWDTVSTEQNSSSGLSEDNGLNTEEMQGVEAEQQMSELDFDSVWFTVSAGDSFNPTATEDGYPILQNIDPELQLEAQGIADDPDTADFSVEITSPDDGEEVTEDESLDVDVDVTNIGGEVAEKTVKLTAPIENEEDVELEADETQEVTFEILGNEVDGEFTITVKSPDDTDQVTVTAVDPCFIATAAYDTPAADEIDILRDFRDDVLQRNVLGRLFIRTYYWGSPPIARWIRRNRTRRELVKQHFVEPLVNIVQKRSNIWKRE